jgi:hydroxymethylpyrimidine/phosphomethylpyrimidine kinase
MRTALTIAGSDSGAGAGIQADLKTFAAHAVYGTTAIAAITAQNTRGVTAVHPLPPELVHAQIEAVATDFDVHAAKTGMLATAAVVRVVAAAVRRFSIPFLVVDPVMRSTSGDILSEDEVLDAMREELLSSAYVVTPNIPEAERLAGITITTGEHRRQAARIIRDFGVQAVIITGGHEPGSTISDLLYDGSQFAAFSVGRVPGDQTHGTGCTFAAAITAHLAHGHSLAEAIPLAQRYIAEAIRTAPRLGHGRGPMNHFGWLGSWVDK